MRLAKRRRVCLRSGIRSPVPEQKNSLKDAAAPEQPDTKNIEEYKRTDSIASEIGQRQIGGMTHV